MCSLTELPHIGTFWHSLRSLLKWFLSPKYLSSQMTGLHSFSGSRSSAEQCCNFMPSSHSDNESGKFDILTKIRYVVLPDLQLWHGILVLNLTVCEIEILSPLLRWDRKLMLQWPTRLYKVFGKTIKIHSVQVCTLKWIELEIRK